MPGKSVEKALHGSTPTTEPVAEQGPPSGPTGDGEDRGNGEARQAQRADPGDTGQEGHEPDQSAVLDIGEMSWTVDWGLSEEEEIRLSLDEARDLLLVVTVRDEEGDVLGRNQRRWTVER